MKVYDMTHADKVIVEHPICPPLLARMGTGGNQVPLVLGSAQANAAILDDDTCPTLTAQMGTGGNNMPLVLTQNQVGEIRCSETVAPTLTGQANASARNHPLVLMDQGGGVMSVEYDKVGTLRAQTHGHEPLVLAVHKNQLSECRLSEMCPPLQTPSGKAGRGLPVVLEAYRISADASGGALPHVFKLRSGCNGGGKGYLGQDDKSFTLATNNDQYLFVGDNNGNANEANARTLLRILRKEVGAKAFAEWRSRVLDSLQQAEVLRSKVYGESVRAEAEEKGPELDDGSLSRTEDLQARTLRDLWERGPNRSTPQGLELAKQLTGELGESLSRMSHEDSPEGSMGTSRVRKLTPIETERLQGFPDNYTRIPWKGKPAEECPDSPRYKAIGNSWAVPCVRWIGKRIQDELEKNK